MQTTELLGAQVVYDEYHLADKPELRDYLAGKEIRNLIESLHGRVILVLGGDGTMLRAIQNHHQEWVPFLGINFGSKGFLLNDRNSLGTTESLKTKIYPLLEAQASFEDQCVRHIAFNEVQVKATSGSMIDLNLTIGGHSEIDIKGDGLLIATPAGSTAYNRSAGWPVLPHQSGTFVATPLLAFEPKGIWPIPFLDSEEVVIRNNNERRRELSVFADTTPLAKDTRSDVELRIRRYERSVELLIADERAWSAKIFEEQGMMRVK